MGAECAKNKIWTYLGNEIRDVRPALRTGVLYYIAFCSNGDMLTNDNSSLSYSRFVLANHTTANLARRWNFIDIGGDKYLVQSASDADLYLTADPATRAVSLVELSNDGTDSDQHWLMDVSDGESVLVSASSNANIAGRKLNGTSSLGNSAYTPVGFIDVGTYHPATEITIHKFDVVLRQPRQASPPAFAPANAFEGTSDIWLTCESSDTSILYVSDNGLCLAFGDIGTVTYTVRSKITSVEGSATASVVTLPHPDAQNKSQWCWAAAAKMVGTNNYGSEALNRGEAVLADKNGRHSYGGDDFFGKKPNPLDPLDPISYTVNAGQHQIVMEVFSDDRNEGGDNAAKEMGLRLASSGEMLVGTLGRRAGVTASSIYWMNEELDNGRFVIANVFRNSDWSGHSVVVTGVSNNGVTDVYEYWDPWNNEGGQFTSAQIAAKTIQLTDDTENRTLAWIQLCTY
jgi:hypothetical protein